MGLSSLQGRLLMIVGRQSDIQLEEMDISQRQNELAWLQEDAAKDYTEAKTNTKLVINVREDGDSFVSEHVDLTYETMAEEGIIPVTPNNEILLKKDEDGNWIIPKDKDGRNIIQIKNGRAIVAGDPNQYLIRDGSKYLSDAESISDAFKNGSLYMLDTKDPQSGKISAFGIAQSDMEWVLDTSDDAAAETKYQYEMAKLSRHENTYDTEMNRLETEYEALTKEYESATKAIDANVERTFNLFQDS